MPTIHINGTRSANAASLHIDTPTSTITDISIDPNIARRGREVPDGGTVGQVLTRTEGTSSPYNWQSPVDSKITIQKNGTTVGDFTLNQPTDETIDISVPTKTSDLTNDGADGVHPFLDTHQDVSHLATKVELQTEVTRAQSAEQTLTSNLTSEVNRAEGAELILTRDLNSEIGNRQSADSILQGNINSESIARSSADSELETSIATEAANRAAGDTNTLSSAKLYTNTQLTGYYVKSEVDTKDNNVLNSAKGYTDDVNAETLEWVKANKQDTLHNQVNIKSINNISLLGSGNISVAQPEQYIKNAEVDSEGNILTLTKKNDTTISFDPNKVIDVKVNGSSVVENRIANINTSEFGKVKDVLVNGESVLDSEGNANVSVPTKTSDLTNDSGFITKGVDNLTNYSTTTEMNTAIENHHDSTKQDKLPTAVNDRFLHTNATTGNLEWSEVLSGVTGVKGNAETSYRTGQVNLTPANIGAEPADSTILKQADVVNNTTTTTINKPLSANMGKELQDQINNLKARGRFLSVWNSTTGLPNTSPTVLPYAYKTGDYYIVGTIGAKNYRPDGDKFTGAASEVEETNTVAVNDMYYYDSSSWVLLHTAQPTVSFEALAGSPYDNTNLSIALNAKQDQLTAGDNISIDSEGVISAIDTTYSAGSKISIDSANQISTTATVVSASTEGTSTSKIKYITIDGTEYKVGGGEVVDVKAEGTSVLDTTTGVANVTRTALGLGNIATHAVSEFATAAQGDKADTAIQPTDTATSSKAGIAKLYSTTGTNVDGAMTQNVVTANFVQTKDSMLSNPVNINADTLGGFSPSHYQTANLVTTISSSSTNTQYPSAKCVYDNVNTKSTVSVSSTGTATDEVKYITVNGTEKKLAGGSGSSNIFINPYNTDNSYICYIAEEEKIHTYIYKASWQMFVDEENKEVSEKYIFNRAEVQFLIGTKIKDETTDTYINFSTLPIGSTLISRKDRVNVKSIPSLTLQYKDDMIGTNLAFQFIPVYSDAVMLMPRISGGGVYCDRQTNEWENRIWDSQHKLYFTIRVDEGEVLPGDEVVLGVYKYKWGGSGHNSGYHRFVKLYRYTIQASDLQTPYYKTQRLIRISLDYNGYKDNLKRTYDASGQNHTKIIRIGRPVYRYGSTTRSDMLYSNDVKYKLLFNNSIPSYISDGWYVRAHLV